MTNVLGSTARCLLTGTWPGWRSQGTEGALHGARLRLHQDLAPARGAEAAPSLFEPCRRVGGDEEVLAGGVLRSWCFRLPDIFSLFTPGDRRQREPPWCITNTGNLRVCTARIAQLHYSCPCGGVAERGIKKNIQLLAVCWECGGKGHLCWKSLPPRWQSAFYSPLKGPK